MFSLVDICVIVDILKDADLATMSSKKIRLQLAEKYSCDLQSR